MRFLQLTWNKWQYLQAWCNQKDQNQQRKLKQKHKISMQKLIWEVVRCRSCQKRKKPSWLQRVVSRSFRNIITKRTKKSQQSQKQKISMQKLIWEVVSCRSCQKRKKPSWLQRVVSRSFRNIITKRTKKSQQSQNQMKRRKRQKSNQSQLSQNN